MPAYRITFARTARRELQRLTPAIAGRILAKIEALGDDPRPSGTRKLKGRASLWRLRVGDYRVVYDINDGESLVDIVIIRHRNEAYR